MRNYCSVLWQEANTADAFFVACVVASKGGEKERRAQALECAGLGYPYLRLSLAHRTSPYVATTAKRGKGEPHVSRPCSGVCPSRCVTRGQRLSATASSLPPASLIASVPEIEVS